MRKIGRNEMCICGSGKKYKKCCMNTTNKLNPLNSLKKELNMIENKVKSIKGKKVGVLCKFTDYEKGFSWGSQRIICEESQIKKQPNFSKDDFIGLIDYLVRTEDIIKSKKIGSSILGYLPYTETWKLSNMSFGNMEKGFILNFYIQSNGISCRECYTMSFDKWNDISKEEQYKLVG